MCFHFWVWFWMCKDLGSDYLELRQSRRDTRETYKTFVPFQRDMKTINVTNPKRELFMAMVDDDQFEKLQAISSNWKMDHKGYVMCNKRVDGKYTRVYMHKEVLGGTGKHLNANRLDNMRSNLTASKKRGRRPINPPHPQPFKLQKTDMGALRIDPTDRETTDRFAFVDYGSKIYEGSIRNGLPHGFGKLVEYETDKMTLGTWDQGVIADGLVIAYKPLTTQMELCPRFRNVHHVRVVYGKTIQMPTVDLRP